jgi:hypothetical protein
MPDNTLAAAQEQDGNREEAEEAKHKDDVAHSRVVPPPQRPRGGPNGTPTPREPILTPC